MSYIEPCRASTSLGYIVITCNIGLLVGHEAHSPHQTTFGITNSNGVSITIKAHWREP